jgi:hypothetical protein
MTGTELLVSNSYSFLYTTPSFITNFSRDRYLTGYFLAIIKFYELFLGSF